MSGLNIILVGHRSSGKSTIGQMLAEKLGYSFLDSDELVVQKTHKSVKTMFAEDGEAAFRALEKTAIAENIGRIDTVLALGGGSLEDESTRSLVGRVGDKVIYLKCNHDELDRRLAVDDKRPELGVEIAKAIEVREPNWQSVCHHEIDTTDLVPDEVLRLILTYLEK